MKYTVVMTLGLGLLAIMQEKRLIEAVNDEEARRKKKRWEDQILSVLNGRGGVVSELRRPDETLVSDEAQ